MVVQVVDVSSVASWSPSIERERERRYYETNSGSPSKRSRMSSGTISVTCSKGHVHPSWNTTGVLRIAKCESVCGFCQKETKTAANLRKHVAIHIKNEGLNLTIAEGSSGRGRLEMPPTIIARENSIARSSSSHGRSSPSQPLAHRASQPFVSTPHSPSTSHLTRAVSQPSPQQGLLTPSSSTYAPSPEQAQAYQSFYASPPTAATPTPLPHSTLTRDPFRALRDRNLATKSAWTVIPAAEGFRILDLCKNLSVVRENDGSGHIPCYNRETIFDEEWQAHMKDVHGVFLLWPETWMKRIEVLDLEAFGGDIGVCNEVLLEGS